MTRVAVIDIGTVTARLAIADVEGGRVQRMARQSTIVNLGEGVDRTALLSEAACERLLACIDRYLAMIADAHVDCTCCTLTSAARDARNSGDLLAQFERRGLVAQVIPGKVEGSLTFLGVAQDFGGERLLVADNGGGSTEFALGMLDEGGLDLRHVRSIDVGCRRITDRFFSRTDPPTAEDLQAAHDFAASEFAAVSSWWEGANAAEPTATAATAAAIDDAESEGATTGDATVAATGSAESEGAATGDAESVAAEAGQQEGATTGDAAVAPEPFRPLRLVVTGGTSTTLVALTKALVPYRSSQVHLATLTREHIHLQERRLASVPVEKRAEFAGIQPQRAPVMLGGTVAVGEILAATGFSEATVSESDLLFGMAITAAAAFEGKPTPVGWTPRLS